MIAALQYKRIIIRTSNWLLQDEEINNMIFHDKVDK